MDIKYVRLFITKLLFIFILVAVPFSIPPGSAISSVQPAAKAVPAEIQEPFTLHGVVKDQNGNPIQTNIYVTDRQNNPLANLLTDTEGAYTVTIPVREDIVVNAFPLGLPQNLIAMPDGYQISKYFQLTKGLIPASENEEASFTIPPAAALLLTTYGTDGSL